MQRLTHFNKKAAISLSAAFMITLFAAPVLAMEGTDDSDMDDGFGDEELFFQDIPSVYAASKHEQKITEAPAAVSIVTADEIRRYGYRNLSEILSSLRGFFSYSDRNYHYTNVRGFGRPGDYDSRLLLLVDGNTLNDNIYSGAPMGEVFPVDVDLIERIEVVRGPGSSLYGTSALFGVINVITKRGRDLMGAELAAETGTYARNKGRFSYGDRLESGVELLVSGSYLESDGDDQIYYPEFDDPATNNGIAEDVDGEAVKQLFTRIGYADFSFEAIYAKRTKDIPTASYGTVFNDPDTQTTDTYYYLDLKYEHETPDGLGLLARLGRSHYKEDGDYMFDYADSGDPPYLVLNKDEIEGNWWSGELQLTKTLWQQHRLILGSRLQYNMDQNLQNYDEEVYLDESHDSLDWGLYIQDEYRLQDNLILNLGLRYDDYEQSGSTLNPRLAVIYNPVQATTLKLLYGSAFRAPSPYEQYYNDDYVTYRPSTDLDAETIKTLELVLEQQINQQLRGVASLYKYKMEDLIELAFDPTDPDCTGNEEPGCLYLDNTGSVEAHGLELELEGKWSNGISGRVSYTYQETEDQETGEILSNSPKQQVKLNLILPVIDNRLTAGVDLRYIDARETLSGEQVDAYSVSNLTLSIQTGLVGLGSACHARTPGARVQGGRPTQDRRYQQ